MVPTRRGLFFIGVGVVTYLLAQQSNVGWFYAAAATLVSALGGLPNAITVALVIGVVVGLLLLSLRWLRSRVGGGGRDGAPAYSALPGRGRDEMRRVYRGRGCAY